MARSMISTVSLGLSLKTWLSGAAPCHFQNALQGRVSQSLWHIAADQRNAQKTPSFQLTMVTLESLVTEEMKFRAIKLNTMTDNILLDACGKCSAMARVSCLKKKRQSAVKLVIVTYTTLVKGYCTEGHVDRLPHVVEDMKRMESFGPDEIMYNSPEASWARKETAAAVRARVANCMTAVTTWQ